VNQDPAERVRVPGPTRRRTAATRTREIDAGTRVGSIYMRSLLREQLRLALRVIATLFATVGSLPLLFHLFPGLAGVHVLGLPLAWLLLGVLVYPLFLVLGWRYIRRAEDNERDFTDLVQEIER
jgi:nucleoside permease NupC